MRSNQIDNQRHHHRTQDSPRPFHQVRAWWFRHAGDVREVLFYSSAYLVATLLASAFGLIKICPC